MSLGVQRFRSADHRWWTADFDAGTLTGQRFTATRESQHAMNLSGPLGAHALEYVWTHGPAWPAGTLANAGIALERFSAFLARTKRLGFSPQAYAEWLDDLMKDGLEETTRRGYATLVRIFAETWLPKRGLLTAGEALSVRRRFKRHFRGFRRRAEERMREQAVSPQEYVRLVRAIRLELEESRRLLDAPAAEQEAYDHHALPLLPFVLLCGVLLAVRSSEVNAWDAADMRIRDGEPCVYVHAPNKRDGYIWLPPTVRVAWDVAERWMARYRAAAAPDDPLLVVRHPDTGAPVRFDTIWVAGALRVFYRKWFARTGRDGAPVLYRERGGERVPFALGYDQYRSAAITEMARHEQNPEKLRIFARHASIQTTYSYYVREAYEAWLGEVARTLAPGEVSADVAAGAELARIATPLAVATPEERAAADAAGARVPGGVCGLALKRIGCTRARLCLLCLYFRIHPDRREHFALAFQGAMARRDRAAGEGRKRDAEIHTNVMTLNQAVLDRIDDYLADLEDGA